MANLQKVHLEEEEQILEVRNNSAYSKQEKRHLINEIKRTPSVVNGNSSFKTTLSLANLNFGFTILVFGLQTKLNGFFFGLAAVCIMMGITLKTSFLQMIHCKNQELDFPEVIERVVGHRTKKVYIVSCCLYIGLNQMINFIYACDMCYWLVSFICEKGGIILPAKSEVVFDSFSFQYMGMIMFVLFNLGFLIKKVSLLSAMGPVGIAAVMIVVLFSIVHGILNIGNINLIFTFDFSFQNLAILMAAYSMGFFGHLWQLPVLKNNSNQANNKRDLAMSFVLTGSLFYIDAFFGSIAIADKEIGNQASILDFFESSWIIFVIRAMVTIQITTAAIMSVYLMRGKLWNIFPEDKVITQKMEISVNVLMTICWLLVQIFNVDVSTLIGLVGALGAFMGIYLFPIYVHLKCIYGKASHKIDNESSRETYHERLISSSSSYKQEVSKNAKAVFPCRGDSLFERLSYNKAASCASEHGEYMKTPKILRFAFYSVIFCIGIMLIGVRVSALFG